MKKFNMPMGSVVITSTFVVSEKMPILYVSREIDEMNAEESWQFHCDNGIYDMSKMLLVSLANILEIDKTVLEVADLPVNYGARRRYINDAWNYFPEPR